MCYAVARYKLLAVSYVLHFLVVCDRSTFSFCSFLLSIETVKRITSPIIHGPLYVQQLARTQDILFVKCKQTWTSSTFFLTSEINNPATWEIQASRLHYSPHCIICNITLVELSSKQLISFFKPSRLFLAI